MSFADSPSLELERQARSEYVVTVAALTIAIGIPWLLPIGLITSMIFAATAAAIIGIASWWSGLIGTRRRVVRALWDSEGRWWLTGSTGERWIAECDASTRVLPGFFWLHWRSVHGAHHMLLWRGSMSTAHARQLAARLRLQTIGAPDRLESDKIRVGADVPAQARAVTPGS